MKKHSVIKSPTILFVRELPRYYRLARLFRFFVYHKYIYASIFRDLFEKFVRGSDWVRPRNVVLKLDSRCNARCKFCYAARDMKNPRARLTAEQWCSVIDQARELGCYTVTLSGGEPLIYPHLVELVKHVVSRKMLAFTTTNGIAATPELLDELQDAGLCVLSISVHGPPEHHDEFVGVEGAFARQLKMAKYCAKNTRIMCRVSHVLTNESVREGWYEYVWDVMKKVGVRTLSILPICINSEDDSCLLDEKGLAVLDELSKKNYVSRDLKNYAEPLCPAAREDLFVSEGGEIQPCPFIPISFGNLLDEPLQDIFVRMQKHPMFRKRYSVCIPARDREFINRYILPALRHNGLPVRIDELDKVIEGD